MKNRHSLARFGGERDEEMQEMNCAYKHLWDGREKALPVVKPFATSHGSKCHCSWVFPIMSFQNGYF